LEVTKSVREKRESAGERLPDFLIVGAMKAGTTSLYRDLLTQKSVFLPIDKEPHRLMTDRVLTPEGRAEYASLFRRARPDQVCGEASTGYTKAPDAVGVPERALEILGAQTKIIYLVREPIARVRSHHYHEFSAGNAPPSIDEAVRTMPALINYTRYAWQIRPWIERFGRENVRILEFGEYTADRPGATASICDWLGVEANPAAVHKEEVFNRGDAKPVNIGLLGGVNRTPLYRRLVRPFLPTRARDRLRKTVLPPAPPRPAPPTEETIAFIYEQLRADLASLASLMGREPDVWPQASVQPTTSGCQ
jgi:hypothetical protein